MNLFTSIAAITIITVTAGGSAFADSCSGRDHTTGTVVGAVGGAAIGGAASNNVGGAVVGGVLGGLAGNAIARSQDCDRSDRQGYESRGGYNTQPGYEPGYAHVYQQGYNQSDRESNYWSVDSYDDFNADYRHIADNIQRGSENGFYTSSQARGYFGRLQQIRTRADWQQRNGRFNPEYTEMQLSQLRNSMRSAREYGNAGNDQNYRR